MLVAGTGTGRHREAQSRDGNKCASGPTGDAATWGRRKGVLHKV
jgi:hypothetical protein